MQTVTVQKIS